MKDCYGSYSYKGWFIFFSEGCQLWEIQPTEKVIKKFIKDLNEDKYNEIIDEWYSAFDVDLKTISATKKYIKENEDKLMSDLKNIIISL